MSKEKFILWISILGGVSLLGILGDIILIALNHNDALKVVFTALGAFGIASLLLFLLFARVKEENKPIEEKEKEGKVTQVCPNCSKEVDSKLGVCPHCGTRLK
ncbi:MAG: hypothetical protein WCS91_05135 [Bacilli bacterium]